MSTPFFLLSSSFPFLDFLLVDNQVIVSIICSCFVYHGVDVDCRDLREHHLWLLGAVTSAWLDQATCSWNLDRNFWAFSTYWPRPEVPPYPLGFAFEYWFALTLLARLLHSKVSLHCIACCKCSNPNKSDELVVKLLSCLSILSKYRSQAEPGSRKHWCDPCFSLHHRWNHYSAPRAGTTFKVTVTQPVEAARISCRVGAMVWTPLACGD